MEKYETVAKAITNDDSEKEIDELHEQFGKKGGARCR